jgi:hypothetical protein
VLGDDGDGLIAHKGRTPGDHLVEHRPKGVKIRSRRHPSTHGLLRRHVRDGSHHHAGLGETGAVEGKREPEVAKFGGAVGGEPDVSRLEVAVDDALAVGVLQRPAHLVGDADRLGEGDTVALRLFDQALHVATGHELAHQVWLAPLLADVVDAHDVGVVAQPPHGLGLALDADQAILVEAVGLDEGEGHVAVELGVVGEVDAFLAALAQESNDLVPAVDKRGGLGRKG